ncbi:hypothetical protein AB0H79_09715 [Micrococcus luteus]|uniref:hypothetical protein n=1 Tax=Micrococcus luteus TaxID=1270 RepID=UPI0033EFFA38
MTSLPLWSLADPVTTVTKAADFRVSLEDIVSGTGRLTDGDFANYEADGTAFDTGDVLFGRLRPYLAKSWRADRPGTAGGDIIVMRPTSRVTSEFLGWVVQSEPFVRRASAETRGVKMPRTAWEYLAPVPVWTPSLKLQRRIADYLDAETAQIDGMMAELDELIRTLDMRRVEAVAQAVHLAEADEDLPEGWVRMSMKYAVLESFTGEWGEDAGIGEVDVPCVRVADFDRATRTVGVEDIPTIRSLPASKANAKALRVNDLLVERSGGTSVNPVGNVVLYVGPEGAVSSNFIECVRVDEARHDPRYWWLLQYAAYRTGFTHMHVRQTTGIQNLDARGFFSEPMPVPSLSEQRRVVAEVESGMARVDAMVVDARRLKDLLSERRSALITAVITGTKEIA